jgi:glutaconate CoA-transferase, subunit A
LTNAASMRPSRALATVDELVASIEPGMMLAIPKDESGAAMEATRALIRRGVRDLRLLCVPVCGMQADLLIGAGCVAQVECGGIVINEIGAGPRFRAAVREGTIVLRDSTCPAIHAALQAGEKGQPFAAVRGILGSDLLHHRDDWRVVANPFGDARDRVVLVPAINPDVFLFHAAWGDRFGNVWIGGRRDLAYTAHSARRTLVTIEDSWDGDLLGDERMAAGTLAATYVSAVAHAPRGAWPLPLQHRYVEDADHVALYARLARSADGFSEYLRAHVLDAAPAMRP